MRDLREGLTARLVNMGEARTREWRERRARAERERRNDAARAELARRWDEAHGKERS